MAAQPKQSLDQYVEGAVLVRAPTHRFCVQRSLILSVLAGMREQIAEAYNQRVTKYDDYVTAFEVLSG